MSYGNYPDLSKVKKVLIIKLRQLGDVLLAGPVFTSLKSALPQAEIDAYIYSESIPLLESHSSVNQCIGYDKKWKKGGFFSRLLSEWRILRKIRSNRYDLVINLTEGDRGAIAAKFSNAAIRVGFDPKGSGFSGKEKLYTHVVKNCPSARHAVERNLDAVRRIGIFPTLEQRELTLNVDAKSLEKMRSIAGSGFILIHPTSRWKFKCWPIEKMRRLSQELLARGHKLVFTSGPNSEERQMIGSISENLGALDLSGQISLNELCALISLSKLLICVDSLPLHLASALKHPVVAIFGPTSDVTWAPWQNPYAKIVAMNLSCRPCYQDGCGGSKVSDCLVRLPVESVLKAAEPFIDGSLRRNSCCEPLDLRAIDRQFLPEKLSLLE